MFCQGPPRLPADFLGEDLIHGLAVQIPTCQRTHFVVSERTLKLIGMGRAHGLFVGSDAGGKTVVVLFSFTATCKLLDLNTFAYLRDVLERLPTLPVKRLAELLPHRWQAERAATTST